MIVQSEMLRLPCAPCRVAAAHRKGEEASIWEVGQFTLIWSMDPHLVWGQWKIWVACTGVPALACSYCCSVLRWTYSFPMTAGVFVVDEVLCWAWAQFYDLTNTGYMLKALFFPPPLLFGPHLTLCCQRHCRRRFALASCLAYILFSSNNFSSV